MDDLYFFRFSTRPGIAQIASPIVPQYLRFSLPASTSPNDLRRRFVESFLSRSLWSLSAFHFTPASLQFGQWPEVCLDCRIVSPPVAPNLGELSSCVSRLLRSPQGSFESPAPQATPLDGAAHPYEASALPSLASRLFSPSLSPVSRSTFASRNDSRPAIGPRRCSS
jgi:hypothetical protein